MVLSNAVTKVDINGVEYTVAEAIANRHVEAIYGNKENKVNIADMEKVKSDFIKANQYELIDPINVLDKLNAIESFINDFMSEVDATLSVSNALTVIEIEY